MWPRGTTWLVVFFLLLFVCFGSINKFSSFNKLGSVDCPACKEFTYKLCGNATGFEEIVCGAIEEVCDTVVCPVDDVIDHLPASDSDGDYFSTLFGLRGSAWRGKDCDDYDNTVYPGRKISNHHPNKDHNCNGISGSNSSGTYEDLLCANTQQRGLILLGDSAGAHFSVPISPFGSVDEWLEAFENELDFPQCSWATAYADTNDCPPSKLAIDSLYLKLWQNNRCNFKDYQNIAVDGARSGAMASNIVSTTARNQSTDNPAVVIYAMLGNDVCTPHPGIGQMTTPAEFQTNVLDSMKWLDQHLPSGSHVVFVGLLHGEYMWEIMSSVQYPYFDVTYADIWHMLSTTFTGGGDNRTLNPCWGWLNPDPMWRNATTQRAVELSAVYGEIIKNYKFKNFDMYYLDAPDKVIIEKWISDGYQGQDLYEAIGGGHPSTTQCELWAESIWNTLSTQHPEVLGAVNPNNAEIAKLFGDQGGYY